MARGSKSKYKPEIHIVQIENLAKAGFTIKEIAEQFKVAESQIYEWFKNDPYLRLAWQRGRNECIAQIEEQLINICMPYTLKTTIKDGNGKIVQEIIKEMPANTHALSLFLRSKDAKYRNSNNSNITIANESSTPVIKPEDTDL